jgi:hypothetical protein
VQTDNSEQSTRIYSEDCGFVCSKQYLQLQICEVCKLVTAEELNLISGEEPQEKIIGKLKSRPARCIAAEIKIRRSSSVLHFFSNTVV